MQNAPAPIGVGEAAALEEENRRLREELEAMRRLLSGCVVFYFVSPRLLHAGMIAPVLSVVNAWQSRRGRACRGGTNSGASRRKRGWCTSPACRTARGGGAGCGAGNASWRNNSSRGCAASRR